VKRHRLGLFVMVDALGHRFLRDHSFLPELEYRAGLRTVLGFSCSCQPTLLTGKLPREHGHGAMYRLRDGDSPLDVARPFAWLPSVIADNHRVRAHIHGQVARRIQGYFSLYECPTRLLPRFDLVEHRSIFRPGGIRKTRSIFDRLVELRVPHRVYTWETPEDQNLAAVEQDITQSNVGFIFLYLPRLDSLLHAHGNGADEVLSHLAWYELQLRRLFDLGEAHADVFEAFVFSDHGMSDVHGSFDLISDVERELGRNGDRYLAFYDSTMARFWVDDPGVHETILGLLESRREGRVIPPEELPSLGVDFADRSQGDIVFVASEGLLLLPSYMGKTMLAGMHGYHPDAAHADACLLGMHAPDESMSHLVDLYTLMDDMAVRLSKEKR
jgi:predicted AlkP superfamily pyrophosphatase or phosphodiesterase